MSNLKYKWADHMPAMIEMWKNQMTIPKIHQAIQDGSKGFTPGLGMVYKMLRAEGYPTDPAERMKRLKELNTARWPSELPQNMTNSPGQLPQGPSTTPNSYTTFSNSQPSIHLPVRNSICVPEFHLEDTQVEFQSANLSQHGQTLRYPLDASEDGHLVQTEQTPAAVPSEPSLYHTPLTSADFQEGQNEFAGLFDGGALYPDFGLHYPPGSLKTPTITPSQIFRNEPEPEPLSQSHLMVGDVTESFDAPAPMSTSEDDSFSTVVDTSSTFTQAPRPATTNVSRKTSSTSLGRVAAWLDSKHLRGVNTEKRGSAVTNDSGYESGRNSPYSLPGESDRLHPRSLNEFKGLHRVPCQSLHEPPSYNRNMAPPQDQLKDRLTCISCQYSGIHNLSWSARNLKLQVFQAELKLQGIEGLSAVYDVSALDLAGNSALHYAASGGAGFDYFVALIRAGVNPYQLNTAGQLFIHCLRPHIREPCSESLDINLFALFKADLVNLLNAFQPKGAFRWPDNDGNTALDSLGSRILDDKIRTQIFQLVIDVGYPLEVSPQTLQSRRNLRQNLDCSPSSNTDNYSSPNWQESTVGKGSTFVATQEKQIRAKRVFDLGKQDPSYVDPETGDNVLHALSRLRFSAATSLLHEVAHIISKDVVDLNLHNHESDFPLVSFIRERPFHGVEGDETGATMSKYLDALLWKDPQKRIPNKINVNMRNREGATALFYAATKARPDSVRSLIEAGANVNARLQGNGVSILRATLNARVDVVMKKDLLKIYDFKNVISYLEHAGAVTEPTIFEERGLCSNSVRLMPL